MCVCVEEHKENIAQRQCVCVFVCSCVHARVRVWEGNKCRAHVLLRTLPVSVQLYTFFIRQRALRRTPLTHANTPR